MPVLITQPRLFPDPQPLVERFGREFFRQLPEAPGVYLMRDAASVLYVGKAKNLRKRLCSYRVANPERMARRTLRLLRLVEQITWEQCDDESNALQRESELLLALKPRFNRAGVWQGPRRFLAWRVNAANIELAVIDAPEDGWFHAGPFGAQVFHLRHALVRLLWCALQPGRSIVGMPAGLFHGSLSGCVAIGSEDFKATSAEEVAACLNELAGGAPNLFHEWVRTNTTPNAHPCQAAVLEDDLESVTNYFIKQRAA